MERIVMLAVGMISLAIGILCIALWFSSKATNTHSKMLWLTIPAYILAVYCLFTSWIWVYYINLFISLPFYIVSLLLNYLNWRKNGYTNWVRNITIIQILAFLFAIAVAFWISLTKS